MCIKNVSNDVTELDADSVHPTVVSYENTTFNVEQNERELSHVWQVHQPLNRNKWNVNLLCGSFAAWMGSLYQFSKH